MENLLLLLTMDGFMSNADILYLLDFLENKHPGLLKKVFRKGVSETLTEYNLRKLSFYYKYNWTIESKKVLSVKC